MRYFEFDVDELDICKEVPVEITPFLKFLYASQVETYLSMGHIFFNWITLDGQTDAV